MRKTPSWPRSWANFSLFCLYSHRNVWANLHLLGQPNTVLAYSGPQRSTTVSLVCDSEDRIIEVSEPETCTYEMTVGTPAVCTEMDMPQLFAGGGAKPTNQPANLNLDKEL